MDLGLEGRVAWVLGASSGLGLACARSLAAEGMAVGMSARDPENLVNAADDVARTTKMQTLAVPLDVTKHDDIAPAARAVADKLGPIDVLVSNSGGPPPGPFGSLDDAALRGAFDITLSSAWHLTKAVVDGMRERGRGCLIYITSWSAKEVIDGLLLSNMMRAGVTGLAKTLSKELGPDGIRVLCVAPGRIGTPRLAALDAMRASATGRAEEDVRAESQAGIPLRRYGRTEELGDVVAFLASDRASYLTGITVTIDGGMLDGLLT
ncbi:MAG TPA: SDR family oxidoreductase [Actinomycetota bacterium]|nr:SDR family oxidoreductase [Actinomycetota bacterium]